MEGGNHSFPNPSLCQNEVRLDLINKPAKKKTTILSVELGECGRCWVWKARRLHQEWFIKVITPSFLDRAYLAVGNPSDSPETQSSMASMLKSEPYIQPWPFRPSLMDVLSHEICRPAASRSLLSGCIQQSALPHF